MFNLATKADVREKADTLLQTIYAMSNQNTEYRRAVRDRLLALEKRISDIEKKDAPQDLEGKYEVAISALKGIGTVEAYKTLDYLGEA